ncbi:hypothetical protein COCNU_02G007000 [Cocos nucifera]|uniref:Protein kinase domain-containing protein n=1 Tax=Cocos nucifera TaxID=13894 RepID=A0A8K0HZE2_COCNU|nr:hypothetical protein COCNU_02G007000 [Cocos nucifera]
MGLCHGKPSAPQSQSSASWTPATKEEEKAEGVEERKEEASAVPAAEEKSSNTWMSPFFPFYSPSPSPAHSLFSKKSPSAASGGGSATATPKRFFRRPFPPPSPAKHIRALLARRHGSVKPNEAVIPEEEGEGGRAVAGLDKNFRFEKGFASKYELGEEVGRGHFGYTCCARSKKGELKGQQVAVKVIPKAKNFLFTSKDESSRLKAIDFGLSDFVKPDERLNDIVGSAYYVAPEVLHRSYSTEADVWSIGVIAYILLCGSRPFWARTESGIFRAVLKAEPSFSEPPWPSLSPEAKDFVRRLLSKDPRRRMTAAQALSHPWIRNYSDIKPPLDILTFRLIKAYMRSSSLRKAALRALSKTLTVDELFYLKGQFALLEPNKNGCITLENIKMALMKNATDAMKESRIQDLLISLSALQYRRMDFDEFCAATLSVHQLEGLDRWEQHARCAYELFEKHGNRAIVIEELASALSKTLTVDELFYLKGQFALLEPNKNGCITLENIKMALMKNATDAMKESRIQDLLISLSALQYRRMDFDEFCAATLSVHQLEGLDRWEQHARCAYELFEKHGNRAIVIEELASELGLSPSVPVHAVLNDWIRHTDGKLSFLGFVKLLRGNKSLDMLKLEECKAYLRKHGLRLSGTKATCIERILEHWRIKDGNGEKLYPRSSFVFNCTGDVCKGDVILFKQRVYEKFDKVTRGASIIGRRTIAGRVVKESYGAAKQQHTFTRWSNEAERSEVLAEKHRRGATARHARAIAKARSANKGSKHQKNCSKTRAPPKKRRKQEQCYPTKKQKQNMSIDKAPFNGRGKTKQLAMARNLASSARNPRQASYFENRLHIQHPIPQRNPFSALYDSQLELSHRNNIVPSEANRGIFGSHTDDAGNLLNVTGRSFNGGNYLSHPHADSHFLPRSSIHPSRPPEFHSNPNLPSGMRFRRWMP